MKITICGSIAFYDRMLIAREELEKAGHAVKLPPFEVPDGEGRMIPVKEYYEKRKCEEKDTGWIWDRKEEAMRNHFEKVVWSDAILVLNYDKRGIKNYVGANTLIEMGLAMHLNKRIMLLNPIPKLDYTEEILGMKPDILHNDLTNI